MEVRAALGFGFGMAVGVDEGVKVGLGVGTFTKTPLFQINFLLDLIQVNSLP